MYIKIYLISISLFLTFFSFGQTKEVQTWRNSHSNVLLIEENDANQEFLDILESKNQSYIVYSDHFTMNDIREYNIKNNVIVSNLSYTERNEIKLWKALHSDVSIISQNDFDQMSVEKQQMYTNDNALVYIGEELVLTEILMYDAK